MDPTAEGRTVRPHTTKSARRAYFKTDRQAYRVIAQLNQPMNGIARAGLIDQLATINGELARQHRDAFGPDPIPDEDGRDLADSLLLSAQLLALLADAEYAAATGTPRLRTTSHLEPHAGPVLDRYAATTDPIKRARLLDLLYEAVVDHVGGQAAEVIACLPAPGRNIAVTFREHLDMLAPRWLLEGVWSVLVIAAAAVAALLVDHPHAGVAAAVVAAIGAGAVVPTRPTGMPTVVAVLVSNAFGLLIGATIHHLGPQWLIVTVSATCVVPALVLYRRAIRQ